MSATVNGLWIQGTLSSMELLTIESFIANGFIFKLWTYDPENINAPENAIVLHAGEIIPSEQVFSYHNKNIHGHGKGSYAGFSDIFRYKLLYEHGGIWADMDITCLKPFEIKEDYFFRYHERAGAVGNFMKCPPKSPVMKWCYEQAAEKVTENSKDWMLPIKLLNDGIEKYQLKNHIHVISNNDNFPEVAHLLSVSDKLPEDWLIIHWMNEEWRRFNLNKNAALENSTYCELLKHYNIPYSLTGFFEKWKYRMKISRAYYFLMCYYYIYKFKLSGKEEV
jgi:hypothetical protein